MSAFKVSRPKFKASVIPPLGSGDPIKTFEQKTGATVYTYADHEVLDRRRRQSGERFFNINGTASPFVPSVFARRSLTAGLSFFRRLSGQAA
jgi:hypothetical protein